MGTNITGIGNANAIGFKSRVTGGAYFPPELKDALVGVWSAYGKSNDSTDRNIIKNKIKDKGGDFVISNAAYKLNSGYGKYEVDFTTWSKRNVVTSNNDNSFSFESKVSSSLLYYSTTIGVDTPSFKIKANISNCLVYYYYINDKGTLSSISILESGEFELPISHNTLYNGNIGIGFEIGRINGTGTGTITQIPSFEGAFVTDGVNDLITSTKTVQEMLGGSNEITVVSMIHQIGFISSRNYARNNYFTQGNDFLTNTISAIGKIGIYGYKGNLSNIAIVNDILGDKKDYSVDKANPANIDSVFSVNGTHSSTQLSSVAWYWTFIAKRVLTEDEINLVIEKYNLDRPGEIVKPDVYYDIKRQKISNDNHSAFDDKLIDYSGNGYDAKLYNFGWKEDSGIGKYETDFTDWKKSSKVTSFDSESIKFTSDVAWVLLYHPSSIGEDIPSFKVRIKLYGKGTLYYNYITQEGKYTNVAVKSEIFETPICYNTKYTGEKGVNVGFTLGVTSGECSGTITQIPEYKDALIFDGIDDYGKVTGLPILKDYTVAADYIRTFAKENAHDSPILSKSKVAGSGAFLFNYLNADSITSSYSFGTNNILKEINDSERKIYYLSKYASDGHNVNAGSAVDYDTMWLGTYRDNISNFFTGALYFAMLFPYSLSEFLLERQIRKARAGTLYSNQVEFRPIIPEDENITKIDYFVVNSGTWTVIKPGDYVDVGARIVLYVYTKLPYKIAGASSTAFTGMTVGPSTALNIWDVKGYIKDKTPQKIKLTLAVNEDIIQWNPTISANIPDSYDAVTEWFANGWETKIAVGDWIKKSDRIFFKLKLKEPLHEIGKVTFGGSECQATKASNWSESNNLWEIVTYSSVGDLSQVFNVQVDEYIRYEDIVQPYPSIINLVSIDKTHFYTYGDKLKVGDVILYNSYKNLLKGLYSLNGQLKYNGVYIYDIDGRITVAKEMVFSWTVSPTWLLDNNEPKVILSPSRLRMPNSSYKILGHIPDISGHGNHGVIHNSAYAEMSGANGYPYDYRNSSFWCDSVLAKVVSGELVEYFAVKNSTGFSNITSGVYKGEIKVTGVTKAISENKISRLRIFTNSTTDKEIIDITQDGNYNIDIKGVGDANRVFFYAIPNNPNESIVVRLTEPIYIEQVGEYEGAYCLDGVDDFVTIPTVSGGGKQVFMKIYNSDNRLNRMLYDQRSLDINGGPNNDFALYTESGTIAYKARNNGKTYIDGILNENITCNDLLGISQNITIVNTDVVPNNGVIPYIGSGEVNKNLWAKIALYDFMLFDEISTDDKIKELNEYVGIEGNVFEFNPTFTIDLPMAIKSIKVYQGGNEISPGYLYPNKDTEFEVYVSLNDGKYAVDTITVDGVEITKDRVVGEYNIFKFILNGSSEQKIKIHSYEYIMYEDINQPYPVIFKVKDRTTNQIYSWGDRIKIGSSIQLIHGENPNLLPELYSIISYIYEGNSYSYNQLTNLVITVTKTISVSCQKTWKLGSNEPKCILSPKRLKLANSSYKYLGYIPDISGNGNNGAFTNFAFSGMSGAGGYVENFNDWIISKPPMTVEKTDSQAHISYIGTSYKTLPMFEYTNPKVVYNYTLIVEITGIPDGCVGKFIHVNTYTQEVANGINTIQFQNDAGWFGFTFYREDGVIIGDCNITIKQIGNYEGAICFDGIDDYVDIPSLSIGGKQVLMKTNWLKSPTLLYDQRASGSFAILTTKEDDATNPRIAYQARNQDGKTYIDGIENNYIETYSLKGITHNITVTNPSAGSGVVPVIGANTGKSSSFAKMALYDFMLFDEVSTNEEIKQLNDIVGIEGGYVQKPPYYWDAYGKTNLDADKATIQQRGTAVGDYDLTNYNHAYDKMSGYGGYKFAKFDNELDWYLTPDNGYIDVVSRNGYSITLRNLSTSNYGWYFQNSTVKEFITKDIPFKVKANKSIRVYWDMHSYKSNGENFGYVVNNITLNPNEDTSINLRHLTEEELTELDANKDRMYYLLWFDLSTLAVDEEVTIEMLPLYPNGLVYDGVDDYSENTSIPAFTDYTYIFKRTLLNKKYNSASVFKGSNQQSGGGAFICDYNSVEPELMIQGYSFGAGLYANSLNTNDIVYGTKNSVNGQTITSGNNADTEGLTIGKWRAYKQMVFYKLMLYPRTTDMLTINMIKNMMAEDGIIDIQGKLFTDKFTGDFNLDFNKDFLIGN